ncbi:hypothetical protein [Cohnella yongneupensis]|uniref:Tyrosine protein kinase n=1 Tax=Cohnella yongneupensis TaxID=425006 RepID=A0ABW0R1R3_9BACL
MYDPYTPSDRNWTSGQDSFPGIGPTFSGPPAEVNPTVLPTQTGSTGSSIKLPFNINISNLNDLKAMFDRMGGIEGVMSMVGKAQKFMSTMQQVAPLVKLFMGKKGSSADKSTSRPRRRRRTTARRPAARRRRISSKKR